MVKLLFSYLSSTKDPKGYIKAPTATLNTKPAPFMASFSSRGPNSVTPGILKPALQPSRKPRVPRT
ncbi:unnamed protein product [Arabidopsis lyrata]|uniref:Uncharacterized protein n=1 Tax=Arabidopsis lyrata subsp. lyrata TaxID=81972 RepID=D7KMY4_ARALL|nr:hypothetical protein ARALYDRAFT_891341 [Arabidopsis lyrata subsp. lyrata]CAH8254616.1 unnamed protein product [Arabidopsis lyrata]